LCKIYCGNLPAVAAGIRKSFDFEKSKWKLRKEIWFQTQIAKSDSLEFRAWIFADAQQCCWCLLEAKVLEINSTVCSCLDPGMLILFILLR
jgi:hypothetical protein